MKWTRGRAIGGVAVLVAVAALAAVAIWLGTRSGDGPGFVATKRTTTSSSFARPEIPASDAARYAALYRTMTVQQTRIGSLRKWPKPYQEFRDQFDDRCYEWKVGRRLYSLCFKDGVLALKDPP
jgi:hypothetical protein